MTAIVAAALRQRVLVIILGAALMVGGLFAYRQLNIEAYPDPVPPLVDVITQNPGQSAEEIERYITIPIEIQMAGLPYVKAVRTISLFGLSDVKVQFTYDVTYERAAQLVINSARFVTLGTEYVQATQEPNPIGVPLALRVRLAPRLCALLGRRLLVRDALFLQVCFDQTVGIAADIFARGNICFHRAAAWLDGWLSGNSDL